MVTLLQHQLKAKNFFFLSKRNLSYLMLFLLTTLSARLSVKALFGVIRYFLGGKKTLKEGEDKEESRNKKETSTADRKRISSKNKRGGK